MQPALSLRLQISPYNEWLTLNETLQALTSQRPIELSDAAREATFAHSALIILIFNLIKSFKNGQHKVVSHDN